MHSLDEVRANLTNTTPWDTDTLVEALGPHLVGLSLDNVAIETFRAQPGVKSESQRLVRVFSIYPNKGMVIGLASPRRIKARTDLLDQLAQIGLQPGETLFPSSLIAKLIHALVARAPANKQQENWPCENACCKCEVRVYEHLPYVVGNTKVSTARAPKGLKGLQRDLLFLERSIAKIVARLDKHKGRRDKLLARIAKLEAKG